MFEKRMQEIAQRKAEILQEIEQANAERTLQLDAEIDQLNAEEKQLRNKEQLAEKLQAMIPERATQEDATEVRAKQLRETRSVTLSGGTLVQAKKTGTNDSKPVEVSSIVDQVNAVPCYGMGEYEVDYMKDSGTGADATEGAEVSTTDPTFGSATITPCTITTYCEVSREVLKLTDQNYLQRVEQAARTALRKKLSEKMVSTTADAKFTSIFNATACVTDVSITQIDASTLRKIAMSYGGDEAVAGNAVLYLNKKDLILFGDVRGTNEKKAVYEITPDALNPNTGMIKDGGLSVRYCLCSNIKDTATATGYCMAYGNPLGYELGVFSDYTVIVDESAALKRRMIAVLGEVMVGGNVTCYDGFVRVKMKTTGSGS